jgi:Flp pilus assembly protein TadB
MGAAHVNRLLCSQDKKMNSEHLESNIDAIEKRIEALSRHQDQQKSFFDSMEGIRWKIVTAFGLGAAIALFISSTKCAISPENERTILLSSAFVIIVSVASLITQVRIYGLLHSTWRRIGLLQVEEANLIQRAYGLDENIKRLFVFPASVRIERPVYHLLTVHMATCIAFVCFIGIGVNSILRINGIDLNYLDLVIIILILTSIIWYVTYRYAKSLLVENEFKGT